MRELTFIFNNCKPLNLTSGKLFGKQKCQASAEIPIGAKIVKVEAYSVKLYNQDYAAGFKLIDSSGNKYLGGGLQPSNEFYPSIDSPILSPHNVQKVINFPSTGRLTGFVYLSDSDTVGKLVFTGKTCAQALSLGLCKNGKIDNPLNRNIADFNYPEKHCLECGKTVFRTL